MELNSNKLAYDYFKNREKSCLDYVESLSSDVLLANNSDLIKEKILNSYSLDLINISSEAIDKNINEQDIDNPYYHFDYGPALDKIKGLHFQFIHSFNGSFDLLHFKASKSMFWHPDNIDVFSGMLVFSYDEPFQEDVDKMENNIKNKYNDDLKNFRELINYMNSDIENYNNNLKIKIDVEVEKRKNKISKIIELSNKFEIPLKKRIDSPEFKPIRLEKKIIKLSTKVEKEEEYYIPEEDYKEICRLIKHCGSSMERIPSTYFTLSEEQLRDIFVSQLNSAYEGQAQGESFRNKGKTDICIEYNNRAAFVTECKIWKGKNILQSTLNQLTSYITWKDSKLGIILFNKNNKNFFETLNTLNNELKNVDNYLSHKELSKNEFELVINSNNSGQKLNIHVFMFNLYYDR